jgi:hypothetical protein
MRPLQDEHHGTTACNDADSCPTLRTGVRGIYLPAPLDAQAGAEVHTGLSWRLQSHLMSPLHGDAVEGPTRAERPPPGSRPFTTRPSPTSLPNGPMMGRSGRHASPVCGIWQIKSTLISVCSTATGPTPWPKKGRWDRVCGVHTPEGWEGHRDHGQPWVYLSSRPRGSRQ